MIAGKKHSSFYTQKYKFHWKRFMAFAPNVQNFSAWLEEFGIARFVLHNTNKIKGGQDSVDVVSSAVLIPVDNILKNDIRFLFFILF